MGPRSLRARLTLWHAGLLALTLACISGLILLLLHEVLYSRADATLLDFATHAAQVIASRTHSAYAPELSPPRPLLEPNDREWGHQIQVVELASGRVLETSPGLAGHALPCSGSARLRGRAGGVTFETLGAAPGHAVRLVTVPVRIGRRIPYLVQAAVPLAGVEEAMQRTASFLLILSPSVFLISLIGGWMLVARSLGPVDHITRTALAIKPDSLSRRLDVPDTDDEIGRLASAFNEMIARLETSFRQIRQFSANASHELKTPLTSMRGEAEVALMAEKTPEEYRRVLHSIVDDVERMTGIIDNLLLLARGDADQIQISRQRVALHEAVMDAYVAMEAAAGRRGIHMDIGAMDAVEAESDPFWLGQIITNLLNNALKYTPPGGTVTLSVETVPAVAWPEADVEPPLEARVTVADTGVGIADEHLPHIFERFYRVDAGRSRETGGSGLGLNIVQMAARAIGGRIEVVSEPGLGTVFTLSLPVVPAAAPSERTAALRRGA